MKTPILFVAATALLCATGCSASNHDFEAVVSGVEQRYSVHAQRIPLMGLVSLCARATTRGGVKDMRIAEFDHIGKLDTAALYSLMRTQLGTRWQPMVTDRSTSGSELSVVFVQPSDRSMRMLVADYENGELDVVRMELNGSALARWMHDPKVNMSSFHSGDFHPGDIHPGQTD